MAEPVWLGGVFLKCEGGYEVVLRALRHYRKRLRTLGQSPELQNSAAMFASVLDQEARKTVPRIDEAIGKIHCALAEPGAAGSLQEDVQILEKALSCYKSDIQKAQDTGNKYFLGLVGDLSVTKNDLELIDVARDRIRQNTYG